jgi:hypothetical protein
MNGFKEYDNFDALGLAGLVKTGEVSPESVTRVDKLAPLRK